MENYKNEERYFEAKKQVGKIKGFYIHLIVYVLVNLFLLISIYASTDNMREFLHYGTFFTPFFWGIGLFAHALGVFGPNITFFKDWENRKMEEFMQEGKQDSNRWK